MGLHAHFLIGFQRNYTLEASAIDIFVAAGQTSFSSLEIQYLLNYSEQDGRRLHQEVAAILPYPHHPQPKYYCTGVADASFLRLKH